MPLSEAAISMEDFLNLGEFKKAKEMAEMMLAANEEKGKRLRKIRRYSQERFDKINACNTEALIFRMAINRANQQIEEIQAKYQTLKP